MAELSKALREAIRAVLVEGAPLCLAVLFGSRATGRAREGSDVDIGILADTVSMSLQDELRLASAFSAAAGAEVDLVRLGNAPLLDAEVARYGVCLLEDAPGTFAAFRADAMSRWIDLDETLAPHRARFLERLARRTESCR